MAKFKIEKFDPVIYPRKIFVAKGGCKKDLADIFVDIENDTYLLSNSVVNTSNAITDNVTEKSTGDYGVIVWLHRPCNITTGVVAHEAVHAANLIYKAIGAKCDVDNDEPHAYLVGYITDCIEKVRKGKL